MPASANTPSLLEYGIENRYPVQLLLASQWGSGSLETSVFRSGPSLNWSVKPAAAEDTLGLVLKGESTLTRRVGRKIEQQPLFTGSLILIPNQVESELKWTGMDEWLHFFINPLFKVRIANEVFDRDPARLELCYNFLFVDPLIKQLGQCLLEEMRTPGPLGHMFVDGVAHVLVMQLFQFYAASNNGKSLRVPRGTLSPILVNRITDYVLANIEQDLRLDDVAREVNVSASHLTRAFKQSTGLGLRRFVIRKRVEVARQLMLTTNLPLREVALRVGFTDQSHFTNSFKQFMYVTPGEFVQQSKNLQNRRKNLQDD
jgi:AraC family transcriptional regulator